MENNFIQIPLNLLEYNELSKTDMIIYGLIKYFNKKHKEYILNYQELCDYLNITYRTAYNSIKTLIKSDLVTITKIKDTKKFMSINTHIHTKEPKQKPIKNLNDLWRRIK